MAWTQKGKAPEVWVPMMNRKQKDAVMDVLLRWLMEFGNSSITEVDFDSNEWVQEYEKKADEYLSWKYEWLFVWCDENDHPIKYMEATHIKLSPSAYLFLEQEREKINA